MPLELTGHAQVHPPVTTGLTGLSVMQLSHQILAPAAPLADVPALQSSAETLGSTWACNRPFSQDLKVLNHKGLKTGRQSPTNRLNFRKFRQGVQAGSSSSRVV